MCNECQRKEQDQDDSVRWLALTLRQAMLMVVREVERRYKLGEHKERKHDQRAA